MTGLNFFLNDSIDLRPAWIASLLYSAGQRETQERDKNQVRKL
jgi:hypothetical protein